MKRDQKATKETDKYLGWENSSNQSEAKTERKPKYSPCETCKKTNHTTDKCYFGANAANRPPPRNRKKTMTKKKTSKPNNPSNNKTEKEQEDLNC